jgi:hypothetical protein
MGYPNSVSEVHVGAINTTLNAPTGKSFFKFTVTGAGNNGVTSPNFYVNGTQDSDGYDLLLKEGQTIEGEYTSIVVPNTAGCAVIAYT